MSRKYTRIILMTLIISISSLIGGIIIKNVISPSYHLDYVGSSDIESLPVEIPDNLIQKEFQIAQDECCGHVDINPPVIQLISPTNNSITSSGALINLNVFEVDTELITVLYHWDDAPSNSTLDAPYDVTVPDDEGTHNLYVYAEDSVANWALAVFTFTVPISSESEQPTSTSNDELNANQSSSSFLVLPSIIAIISTVTIINWTKKR
ncbi:hypothetical protein CEE45_11835 [Candidatus Heimdallarchaeota archaeon B3_Heim]|nr:MAG: hypothetical protein CEE45_11835 [Candidatus Heimdallarchaeota archaeon B3_Heim]